VRFHPLNNYVSVPPVNLTMIGNEAALIGVRSDPVFGFAKEAGTAAPLLGAVIEGTFEAEAIGQAEREFSVALHGKELGRIRFDFARIE
jgi:hypothetical protein